MGLENYKAYELKDKEREYLKEMRQQIQDHNYPERSKREDFNNLGHEMITIPLSDEVFCKKCGERDIDLELSKIRCSEHDGNDVREVQ